MHDHDIARALAAPGKLSRLEKEAIFDRVVPAPRTWRLGGAVLAAMCAAAGLLLVLSQQSPSETTMTARGSAGATMVVRCGARAADECKIGDRMTIDFGMASQAGHLGLLARAPDSTIVWYFPSDDGTPTIPLAQRAPAGVLDSVVTIDSGYVPGRYDLFAIISDLPMTRAEIRDLAQGDRLVARPGVNIEQRTFVVQAGDTP